MKIIDISIGNLKQYDKNAKKHDPAQIAAVAASIQQFGFVQPVVIDRDGVIVIGHCRVLAAKKLGLESIPCLRVDDLTDEQVKALRLADNKTNESPWDVDLLAESLNEIFDIDMTAFGFDLLNSTKEIVEDDAPDIDNESEPITHQGDIWQLGRHRLMCGDSTNVQSVELLMDGHKADMLLTDPPYNVAYEGKTKDALTIQNDNMGDDQFREFLRSAFYAADNVMRPGAVFYIWHADSEGYNFRGACNDIGWTVRQCFIWLKNCMVMGRQDYQWKHEPCLYGWKDGAGHLWASDRKQTTILEFDRPQKNKEHPTMKPVKLFDYQMRNNTKNGDIVLDLFGGSGTTIIAAEQNGRSAYIMELDPRYCDVIIKRWEALTGEKAVMISGEDRPAAKED